MKFGLTMFPADTAMNVVEVGQAAEDRGFEALLFPEHTHIPISRRSPFPYAPELPAHYSRTLDPFVSLAAVAARTTRLKIGTAVCLVVERDPITLAKEVASLDLISGGRFLFGIGGGWNREEMENHGTDPRRRWRLLRDRVLAMKAIWANDEAEYHGEFVDFDPIWQWPKPVQEPHPPIWIGGDGPRTLERIVDYCDGWMPIGPMLQAPIEERMAELRRLAGEAGRACPTVVIYNCAPDQKTVERYREAGVDWCLFQVPPRGPDEVLPVLDRAAKLIDGQD